MITFRSGDRFSYYGSIYTIKQVTANAIEIASNEQQSLWVSIDEFMENLELKGHCGLFRWLNEVSRPPRQGE